jgi:7-keto-8-aminopelargonate synthetase-like enzyme
MLVVVDGLYSMMGDLAPLKEIRALADRYGARLMVDEAHAVGVLGKHGRGAAEHCGIHPDLVMGTFSKSFASLGGFIAGPAKVVHFMRHHARALIFSASITPASAAAALAALDLIEQKPEMRTRVLQLADRVRKGLAAMGFQTAGTLASPIVPVVVGDQERMLRLWRTLFECGLFTNAVTQPTGPGLDPHVLHCQPHRRPDRPGVGTLRRSRSPLRHPPGNDAEFVLGWTLNRASDGSHSAPPP